MFLIYLMTIASIWMAQNHHLAIYTINGLKLMYKKMFSFRRLYVFSHPLSC